MRVRPSVNETRSFPYRLKDAMNRRKVTQEELAKKVGASQSSVSYWLLGDRFPRLPTLYKLAEVLDVNPLWLIGHDAETESEAILEKYFALEPADQVKVMGYIDAILSSDRYNG